MHTRICQSLRWMALGLCAVGCVSHRELGGTAVIAEHERMVIGEFDGFVVELQRPDVLAGPRLRTALVVRSRPGSPSITELSVVLFTDQNANGQFDSGEPGDRLHISRPEGKRFLAAHLQHWHRPGERLLLTFAVGTADGPRTESAVPVEFVY